MRRWKRHRSRWEGQRTFSGKRYLELLRAGRVRGYELGELRHELRRAIGGRALELLEHILAAERAFGADGGLLIAHATTAEVLGCSQRTAQDVVHELVDAGLVDQRPWFRALTDSERIPKTREEVLAGAPKYHEVAHRYCATAAARRLVAEWRRGRGDLVGKKNQPGKSQRSPSGLRSKGVPGRGRPAQAFVDALLASRRPPDPSPGDRIEAAAVRVVQPLPGGRMLLSDGREVAREQLDSALMAQRLRTRRERGLHVDDNEETYLAAMRAFDAHVGRGT